MKAVVKYDPAKIKKEPGQKMRVLAVELHKVFAVVNSTDIGGVYLISCEQGTKAFDGALVSEIRLFPE